MTQEYGGGLAQRWGSGRQEAVRILERWRCGLPLDRAIPEDEALLVVDAVLADQHGPATEALEVAGRSWGRAHLSVGEMVERLSRLRAELVSSQIEDQARMHGALDRVTRAATEEVLARVERLSRTDALTGVGNRRAFDETIQWALSASSRQGHDVTVVVVDVDRSKVHFGLLAGRVVIPPPMRRPDEQAPSSDICTHLLGQGGRGSRRRATARRLPESCKGAWLDERWRVCRQRHQRCDPRQDPS